MRNLACGNQYMLLVVMQTASAKPRSAMWGASHQSAFMNSCLTISNTLFPVCLVDALVLVGVESKDKIMLQCFREVECKHDFTTEI